MGQAITSRRDPSLAPVCRAIEATSRRYGRWATGAAVLLLPVIPAGAVLALNVARDWLPPFWRVVAVFAGLLLGMGIWFAAVAGTLRALQRHLAAPLRAALRELPPAARSELQAALAKRSDSELADLERLLGRELLTGATELSPSVAPGGRGTESTSPG